MMPEPIQPTSYVFLDGHHAVEPDEISKNPEVRDAWLAALVEEHGKVVCSGRGLST